MTFLCECVCVPVFLGSQGVLARFLLILCFCARVRAIAVAQEQLEASSSCGGVKLKQEIHGSFRRAGRAIDADADSNARRRRRVAVQPRSAPPPPPAPPARRRQWPPPLAAAADDDVVSGSGHGRS